MMMLDTITKNKRKIIGLLILVATICVVAAYVIHHNRRANARVSADRIIAGEEQATREQISKIIHKLYSVRVAAQTRWRYIKNFMEDLEPLDRQRVKRLSKIRAELWFFEQPPPYTSMMAVAMYDRVDPNHQKHLRDMFPLHFHFEVPRNSRRKTR